MTKFQFYPERCVGCYACVSACIDEHTDVFSADGARRRILQQETPPQCSSGPHISWQMQACLHCETPACKDACPMDCFFADLASGTVQLDTTNCIGCGICANACPHSGILWRGGAPLKCDACLGRLQEGKKPRCVDACPCKAIDFQGFF